MFAIVAAVLFGVALLLDLVHQGADFVGVFTLAGFLCLALHFALGVGLPWRRQP